MRTMLSIAMITLTWVIYCYLWWFLPKDRVEYSYYFITSFLFVIALNSIKWDND